MNLSTIAPHQAFLDALAADWLREAGDDPLAVADGLILLPTRRAARALAEAFLARTEGRPLLLPRILAIGALDEAPLALAGALALRPAVPAPLRLAHLARLVMALDGRFGAPATADHAWPLAVELAALMDEAERAEIDLATVLPDLVAADYAEHWGITLEFLRIVTRAWPDWLAEMGLMNPAARQVLLLDAQAEAWRTAPPEMRVLAAGSTGGIPAVARLLKVVAGLPKGQVVLPGLDLELPDVSWDALEDSHPQSGLRRLLNRLDARRGDVQPHPAAAMVPSSRTALLHRALLPAQALEAWRETAVIEPAGIFKLAAADQQEEALAIALILRGALEVPDRRAALVTPDRDLAGRVAVELGRFGIVADDSAGEPLSATPPAVFLRLLAQAVANALRPGAAPGPAEASAGGGRFGHAECRALARQLEREGLRGPAPPPGVAGLRAIAKSDRVRAFVEQVVSCLAPLLAIAESDAAAPAEAMTALISAAEVLAGTPDLPGARRLWSGEEGQALAALLAELLPALAVLPPQPPGTLPGLLDATLAGVAVRSRRALRGRDGAEHRAFSFGGCWRRGCSVRMYSYWAGWPRGFGRPPPIPVLG